MNNGEENKRMFRRGEVWVRQESTTPQQARRQSGMRPTRRKTKGRTQDYTTGKARKYMASKHQTTTRKSAYSWAPPKPKTGVIKLKHHALNTDETSHPHALVYLYHMIPTLPADQTEMNVTKRRCEHGTSQSANETTSP